MLTNVWAKYLPVLRIVFKRSLTAEQHFALNSPDFERAGFTRKSGYKFQLKIKNGKLSSVIIDMPIASMLTATLLEDKVIRELLLANEFHIGMNTKYELTIKNIPQHQPHEDAVGVEAA